ncbi:hypothetical protein [uncultured Cohaesibacter sp.]|uniref:hypothetical protein n=1 Tax=uncultured Cohaesibacter sp. TaxID=1002546 RepID=UPI0029C89128|nr:hypothetical protein [uncultured Cohaesibacter sp.]
MKGSGIAILASAASVYAFFANPAYAGLMLALSALLGLVAAWWRGRPSLLLLAYCLFAYGFICLPQALPLLLVRQGVDLRAIGLYSALLFPLGAAFAIACLFIISCRRQSGGVRLSALEVSEDLETVACLLSRLLSLLYVPLVLLPVYYLATAQGDLPGSGRALLYWSEMPLSQEPPKQHIIGWLVVLLLLGHLAAAYMRDVHHRYSPLRKRMGNRMRAWFECLGALLLLLPMSWGVVEMGWAGARGLYLAANGETGGAFTLVALIGPVPDWLLYGVFPAAFLLVAASAVALMLRSLVYLFGPPYLKKRAATHLDMVCAVAETGRDRSLPSRFGAEEESVQ